MEEQGGVPGQGKIDEEIGNVVRGVPDTVMKVVTDAPSFFREMPRTGGYAAPLVFMVVMGVAAGIVQAILGIVGLHPVGGFFMALAAVVIVPVVVAVFGFVGAGISHLVWRALGSQEPFECSYRCVAYASAVSPLTVLLGAVPYLGSVAGIAWMTWLMVTASVAVHRIDAGKAWKVFGAIGVVLALLSLSGQAAGRKAAREMERWEGRMDRRMDRRMEDLDKMSPEEAGKAVGDFLKGMEEAGRKKE